MSWLARSIANSLHLDDDEDDAAVLRSHPNDAEPSEYQLREMNTLATEDHNLYNSDGDGDQDLNQGRGVKEDLSEIKDSITRQFWGVASFLAPPPPPVRRSHGRVSVDSESMCDRAEPGNGEESGGLEISLQLGGYNTQVEGYNMQLEDYNANALEETVGITEEVLAFGRNIAHHPETWLDFPLLEDEEFNDYDISDTQYKHALSVERLAPRLAALRIELCPAHMSEGYFWMVYFILLHSRLNKHDSDLLSSPQILEARAMWMQELQKRTKDNSYWLGTSTFHLKKSAESSPHEITITPPSANSRFGYMSDRITPFESTAPHMHHMTDPHEMLKHPYDEIEFIDKSVIKEDPLPKIQEKAMVVGTSSTVPLENDTDDEDDDWLKDDTDLVVLSRNSIMVNEEDISFSDLEDDFDDCTMLLNYRIP